MTVSLPTLLGALLVLGGIAAAAVALAQRDRRRVSDLRQVLELQYLEDERTLSAGEAGSLLARSGALAERALANTSSLSSLSALVQRSDWKLSPGEVVAVSLAAGAGGLLLGALAGSPVLVVLLGVVGLVAPIVAVRISVSRRSRRFAEQFPDILDIMAASLESGAGVQQALELVVAEADDPAASEFARVLSATRLGTPLIEAMATMAERLDSTDLRWTVQAIAVQQRTGGRLAEVLRIVAGVMRARVEIARELAALTAEGRLSAYILAALPVGFALFLSVVQPDYLRPLYASALGLVMLGLGAGAVVIGFVAMLRIVKVEV